MKSDVCYKKAAIKVNLLLICLPGLFITPCRATSPLPIKIDVKNVSQTIAHFGASDCWSFQKIGAWDVEEKEQIADLLFSQTKGIGLSAWRFNIGAGINKVTIQHPWRTTETFEVSEGVYDWARQANERWFLHAAQERGVHEFVAFVNSPPARMTRNSRTNGSDGLGSTNLKSGYEAQFARYLVDILKYFRDHEKISFDYISPVNEPQWEWNNGCNQEGNRAANADIIAIVDALYDELQKQKVETQISLVESGDIPSQYLVNQSMSAKYGKTYGNYLKELFGNPEISGKIAKHFGGHSYWSDRLSRQLVEHRTRARTYFQPFFDQGWSYWETEYCILDGPEGAGGNGRDLTIKSAIDIARVIHHDLTYLDASAWNWWTAVSPEDYKDGLIYTNYKNNPASQSIIESKILWALGNYSRYIRPGAKRIGLDGAADKLGLMGSAYLNETGTQLIVVLINAASEATDVSFTISGLDSDQRISSLTPLITSAGKEDNLKEYAPVKADSVYTVPARCVVTLLGQISKDTQINRFETSLPHSLVLLKSYPNPFNNSTRIELELDAPALCRVNVHNNAGQIVRTLYSGVMETGVQSLVWDATDARNRAMSSGVYFCSVSTNYFDKTIKLVLVQ